MLACLTAAERREHIRMFQKIAKAIEGKAAE
jgi:hypothetical protein